MKTPIPARIQVNTSKQRTQRAQGLHMADKKTGKHANKALMNTLCTVQIMPARELMFHDLTTEECKKVRRYQLIWFFVGLTLLLLSTVFISMHHFSGISAIFAYICGISASVWTFFPSLFTTFLRLKNSREKS